MLPAWTNPLFAVVVGAGLLPFAACHDVYVYPLRGGAAGGAGAGGGGAADQSGGQGGGGRGGQPVISCPPSILKGFATVSNGGGASNPTTGGAGGPVMMVRTLDELQKAGATTGPLIIHIQGLLAASGQTDITSDKTVVGDGTLSGLTGGGLRVKQGHNVIFRNLVITKAVGTDAIELETSVNVWIDHCDLSSEAGVEGTYDGLIDIKHASDFVTVSWTRFHDHHHASLIGHSSDNAGEDTGHLTVTYYGNLFERLQAECPRARFGQVHLFNNFFRNVGIYAIASQMGARVLVERNVFEDVVDTMLTQYLDPMDGILHEVENIKTRSGAPKITADVAWTPPYAYTDTWLPVADVSAVVDACAGVIKP